MPNGEIDYVEADSPGFVVQRIAMHSSYINGRLRKRYGNAGNIGNSLPFGITPPLLVAAGTNPPAVTLSGRPTLGSIQTILQIVSPGILGTATFKYSLDGGVSFSTPGATAAIVTLGTSGLSANFSTGSYGADNQWFAAPPVPEIIIQWLVVLVTNDLYRKRGRNPEDAAMADLKEDVTRVYAELKEAADSKDGLFDLPSSEDTDSAVTTGGPLGYSETSPYIWQDFERAQGISEDQIVLNNGGAFLADD